MAEELTAEERKKRQERSLAALRGRETEVPTAERGTETYATGGSQGAKPYAQRETLDIKPKATPPAASGVKPVAERAGAGAAEGMPKQADYPDTTSWASAVREWRERKREEAAPQKAAIARARKEAQ